VFDLDVKKDSPINKYLLPFINFDLDVKPTYHAYITHVVLLQ